MSMGDDILPGMLDGFALTDEAILHQGGLDSLGIRTDDADTFPNDPGIGPDGPHEWKREQLPQFGPSFVSYVDERFTRLERMVEKAMERWMYEPVTTFYIATFQSDASGNVNRSLQPNSIIAEPPPGFTFALHRLMASGGGFSAGVPFTGPGAYWELRVNDEMVDGGSLVSGQGQLPFTKTWGTRDAPHIRDGEVASFFMANGPTNGRMTLRLQGTLDRTAEG